MPRKPLSSLTDQVTDLLRQGILSGRWRGTLPGRNRLAEEIGCCHGTMERAMRRLSREGLLVSQGAGQRRRIHLDGGVKQGRALRVVILLYEFSDQMTSYLVELVHKLQLAGHEAGFSTKSMLDLDMDAKRIARFVEATQADAWVVISGPRDVLEWFAAQSIPTFALFGHSVRIPVASAGPKKAGALEELVDKLVDFGHQRIVMVVREDRRKPELGLLESLFLNRLEAHGIRTGSYNMPDWEDNAEAFSQMIDSLFRVTPPTALIIGDPMLLFPVVQHLASRGISAPAQVSLACTDVRPSYYWCKPNITHIAWDSKYVVKRVESWAKNISLGKQDLHKGVTNARLVSGGTIGPVPKEK
jgi:DNA-binding LacI/PurR family transcriptional regulator